MLGLAGVAVHVGILSVLARLCNDVATAANIVVLFTAEVTDEQPHVSVDQLSLHSVRARPHASEISVPPPVVVSMLHFLAKFNLFFPVKTTIGDSSITLTPNSRKLFDYNPVGVRYRLDEPVAWV